MTIRFDGAPNKRSISVQTFTRGDLEVHRYRRPAERWATIAGGLVVAFATGIPLISYVAANSSRLGNSPVLLVLLLCLYVGIFAAYFFASSKVGVETTSNGVKSISLTRRAFVEWQEVARFVVDRYTPLSACVLAEGPDGARVPLNALAAWGVRANSLKPYCDALNAERRVRGGGVSPN
jgi:hypothetical protein